MKYSDFIKVNENFQYSVNLQFDLNNIDKIKNYIPTKDGCEVIKIYIKSVIEGKNRATSLIGPYGKGKSHLLLVLIAFLSDYDKNDIDFINELIEKIKIIDEELYEYLIQIRKNKFKLLPVIINSNYDNLNQAFLLGINDALRREKINNIVLNTSYDAAYNILFDWYDKHAEIKQDLSKCLLDNSSSYKAISEGLQKYEKKSYEIFKKVYECITHGQTFNPLVNSDIVKNYQEIVHNIQNNGYNGVFIAFDEFSKFLDSSNQNTIMKDLKLLQDFAELANRTGKNEQIHISCITHKGFSEYINDESLEKINAYKTVEGRFKNIYFNRSMEQNYEIVSYALKKQKEFEKFYSESVLNTNATLYLSLKEIQIFSGTKDIESILFKGCFPLNPITVYSLIELSEKIAQNERTLFTFLTDDDQNGLKKFINSNSKGLFNNDKIYDYFEPLFKNTEYIKAKEIWQKSSNILRKNISELAKKIIKSMSVIYMINEMGDFTPTCETIRLSLDVDENQFNKAIDELIDKSLIRKKKISEELDFATMYSKILTSEIKELVLNRFSNINEKESLEKIIGITYSLPRRYNEEFKMTRFFSNIFINENEIINLNNFDLLHEKSKSDGIILNLIRSSKNINEIINHFRMINDDRAVLKVSRLTFKKSFINLLKEYEAASYLIVNGKNSEDEIFELEIIRNEIIDAVKEAYKYYFSQENILDYVYLNERNNQNNNLSSLLSRICEEVYYETPKINNEMINKEILSSPIKKAREIVITSVLNNDKEIIKSKTSAEATIYKAIVDKRESESITNIINIIKNFIQSTDNEKVSFEKLYDIIRNKPYSIRLGTIPILISIAISDYSDNNNIILYYMKRELELTAENIIKINDNPKNYFLLTEKGTKDRINYISSLEKIYNINVKSSNIRVNVSEVVEAMKKWVFGLPRLIRELNTDDKDNNITEEQIKIKSALLKPDINNNEFLFITIPKIFSVEDFNSASKMIEQMKKSFDEYVSKYIEKLIIKTKDLINPNYKGSLSTLLMEWNKSLDCSIKNNIYDVRTKNLINLLEKLNTHDEYEVIELLSKIFTSFYVEDWQSNQIDEYSFNFKETIEKLKNVNISFDSVQKIVLINGNETVERNITSQNNISALGKTMKNNIEEIIEEYGNSLSEEEKVNILLNIMREHM